MLDKKVILEQNMSPLPVVKSWQELTIVTDIVTIKEEKIAEVTMTPISTFN